MANIFGWSKLTLKQKYDYGVWIVISTMSVIISSFFAIIVSLNNEKIKMQNDFENQKLKAVAVARTNDSLTIAQLSKRAESAEVRYLNFLETKEKKLTELVETVEFFKIKNQ